MTLFVDAQDKALKFDPNVLGFAKKSDFQVGRLSISRLIFQHWYFLSTETIEYSRFLYQLNPLLLKDDIS